jgi:bifunctional non-homologous end joining protein LigD
VALDRTGWPLFGELQRADAARLAYAAFDLLWLDGRDLRDLPLRERKVLLSRVLPATKGVVFRVLSLNADGAELFEAVRAMDLEGIVAKRAIDRYGPATVWVKVKNPDYSQVVGRADLFNRGGSRS